ncbi:hypothetical protein FEM03_19270 [Phragmitibacter flavus]|uniref:Uncharacterized protein n=1 Tax=Phragmitibacter flavus TaxID=2576071 RepID=A0A5R8KCD3_9BACT|nr:hypothetical protein FEM03_19270 [Phragmitibacter flavus]
MRNAEWIVGSGQWAVGSGQWAVGSGQWSGDGGEGRLDGWCFGESGVDDARWPWRLCHRSPNWAEDERWVFAAGASAEARRRFG